MIVEQVPGSALYLNWSLVSRFSFSILLNLDRTDSYLYLTQKNLSMPRLNDIHIKSQKNYYGTVNIFPSINFAIF